MRKHWFWSNTCLKILNKIFGIYITIPEQDFKKSGRIPVMICKRCILLESKCYLQIKINPWVQPQNLMWEQAPVLRWDLVSLETGGIPSSNSTCKGTGHLQITPALQCTLSKLWGLKDFLTPWKSYLNDERSYVKHPVDMQDTLHIKEHEFAFQLRILCYFVGSNVSSQGRII